MTHNTQSGMRRSERLSLAQLEGMLEDLERCKTSVIKGDFHLDINIVEDDIESMKALINDIHDKE